MAEVSELEERLKKLEGKKTPEWFSFSAQNFLAPVLVLGVGYFLNGKIDEAKLAINQVEAVSKMTGELFSETPARVLITVRLLKKIVDDDLAKEITSVVVDHYSSQLQPDESGKIVFSAKKVREINDLLLATLQTESDVATKIAERVKSNTHYLVVASLTLEESAVSYAKKLVEKWYDAEVHFSTTGYYGVTIGRGDVFAARKLFKSARAAGDAPKDAYLHDGSRFIKKVFPK